MNLRQLIFVICLTLAYLCVELAFNARLLDLIGGVADPGQLENIEFYGRMLSGVAFALFVLQYCLTQRNKAKRGGRPGPFLTILATGAAGVAMYFTLFFTVEYLVWTSDAEFRKASVSMIRLKAALVDGRMRIDGLSEEPDLFSQPAGKAFIGLFPFMATSLANLDETIYSVKNKLVRDDVENGVGGPEGYFKTHKEAVKAIRKQWDKYRQLPVATDLDALVERQHARAWGEYLSDIGKRGWTPSSVPPEFHRAVRKQVRRRVDVARDWDLGDEAAFREAVARSVARKMAKADGSIRLNGHRIPPGLGWEEFFAHPAVQSELREKLALPAQAQVKPWYADYRSFERALYQRMLDKTVQAKMRMYEAPAEDFANGGKYQEQGRDAAKAVYVPPIALFCSLLGAILHFSKLVYLLLLLVARASPALAQRMKFPWMGFAVAAGISVASLSLMDNAVTRSRTYVFLNQQILASGAQSPAPALKARLKTGALHLVSVGQAYGYPINEQVRVRVLRGFTFGYADEKK